MIAGRMDLGGVAVEALEHAELEPVAVDWGVQFENTPFHLLDLGSAAASRPGHGIRCVTCE